MRKRARIVDEWVTRKIRLIILILALLTVGQMAYFSYQSRTDSDNRNKVTQCQVDYNRAVSAAVKARAIYSQQDRDSLVAFVREVATAKTRAQSRASLEKYLRTQDEIDRNRQSHPIPDPPAGKCS